MGSVTGSIQGRSQRGAGAEIWKNQPQKQGKSGKMGRKRENWEENGKLAGSLPLRTGRATALFIAQGQNGWFLMCLLNWYLGIRHLIYSDFA